MNTCFRHSTSQYDCMNVVLVLASALSHCHNTAYLFWTWSNFLTNYHITSIGKKTSSPGDSCRADDNNNRYNTASHRMSHATDRNVLVFNNENDKRIIMELPSADSSSCFANISDSSSGSVMSSTGGSKDKNVPAKQATQNETKKNTSPLKTLLCFSEEEKKQKEKELNLKTTTTLSSASNLVEYQPKDDERQDDEYCLEGYYYLNGASMKQHQLLTNEQRQQPLDSSLKKIEIPQQSQKKESPSKLTPATRSSSASNTVNLEESVSSVSNDAVRMMKSYVYDALKIDIPVRTNELFRQKDGSIVASKVPDPSTVMSRHRKSKSDFYGATSTIPMLEVIDARTTSIIPTTRGQQNHLADKESVEVVDISLMQSLVVRPTWTNDDDEATANVDDANLIFHKAYNENSPQTMTVSSQSSTRSMVKANIARVKNEESHSVWKNFLFVSPPTLRQKSKPLRAPITVSSRQSMKKATKLVATAVPKTSKQSLRDGNPETAKQDGPHVHRAASKPETNPSTSKGVINRARVSSSVSFMAIDMPPSNHKLDNTRNDVAFYRCMARKGAGLLSGVGGSVRNKLRLKSSLKKSSYQPNNDAATNQSTLASENVPIVSTLSTERKALNNAFPLALCRGPMWKGSPNNDNDDDDEEEDDDNDSCILIPVNSKLERTRSPHPLFKKRGVKSLASEEEDEEESEQRQMTVDKSWMHYLFSQNGDDNDNDSMLMDTTFEGSNVDDDDEVGDLPAMTDELVYEAQQLGRSLSQMFETTRAFKGGSLHQEEHIIPIIVYQQPESVLEMSPTKIQSDDCSSSLSLPISLAL
jgi:hypothetical protein